MAWSVDKFRLFASGSSDPMYDYNFNPFSGATVKGNDEVLEVDNLPLDNTVDSSNNSSNSNDAFNSSMERKRRMRWDQIESLEKSFQEEIKLEPERKMKLAKELGLHPRKVAVWFQNRRARWKAKQLENLYVALKKEFDIVSREKHKLQEEVMKLKAKLDESAAVIQSYTGCAEASAEETAESRSAVIGNPTMLQGANWDQISNCSYILTADDYNPLLPSFWGILPGYP